jgi:hypothetical protein
MQQLKVLHSLYEDKRQGYWRSVFADSRGDMKKLWRTFSSITGSHSSSHSTAASVFTADDFATFLFATVAAIRSNTETAERPDRCDIPATATEELSMWDPVTPSEVVTLIGQATNKTCQLDPAPSWIIKQFANLLAPFIFHLLSVSFSSGLFRQERKHAVVLPLLRNNFWTPLN